MLEGCRLDRVGRAGLRLLRRPIHDGSCDESCECIHSSCKRQFNSIEYSYHVYLSLFASQPRPEKDYLTTTAIRTWAPTTSISALNLCDQLKHRCDGQPHVMRRLLCGRC